jgi:Tfp pilus assembly protein FimT
LVEQLWVLLISGVLLAATVAGGARLFDAMTVRAAARDVADLFAVARDHAVEQGLRTAVRIDARAGRVIVHADGDTLSRLELRRTSAVRVEASRDSMAYSASGLGFGAANMRVIVSRGASADTITVSRLGRVRR